MFTKIKHVLLKKLFRFFESMGIHILPVHFYSPIPDTRLYKKKPELWKAKSPLYGIEMNTEGQLALVEEIYNKYYTEYKDIPLNKTGNSLEYYLNNSSFGFMSGQMHYGLIRHLKPKRYIEIGSGFSTLISLRAFNENLMSNNKVSFTAIEPYPPDFLNEIREPYFQLDKNKLEDTDLTVFDSLEKGDMLFIDSTHVAKFGSDVNYYMFQILPRIKPGVLVHIHDIQFPFDYHASYMFNSHYFWNEQYMVQAFLMYNSAFHIYWCASFMVSEHAELMKKYFPHFDEKRIPTSLYIIKNSNG